MGTVAADWEEVAALGLNFNEISAANSGRKERRDVMRGRMRRR